MTTTTTLDSLLDALDAARMRDDWQGYADAADALRAAYAAVGVDWASVSVATTARRALR